MPSLAELMKQKLKEQEELKKEPEVKITPEKKVISISDLKPPKLPLKKISQEDFFIDWDYLAHNSSFQRGFTEFIKHTFPQYKTIDHRASKNVMNKQLKEKTNEIATALNIVNKIDSKLLRELRENPLYIEQKSKHNK